MLVWYLDGLKSRWFGISLNIFLAAVDGYLFLEAGSDIGKLRMFWPRDSLGFGAPPVKKLPRELSLRNIESFRSMLCPVSLKLGLASLARVSF